MPLVYDWLKYAEGTRRIIKENYQDYQGEALLNAAIEENVLTKLKICELIQLFTLKSTKVN